MQLDETKVPVQIDLFEHVGGAFAQPTDGRRRVGNAKEFTDAIGDGTLHVPLDRVNDTRGSLCLCPSTDAAERRAGTRA